ncbi:uncharacterized protein LOC106181105 [Lingula anatina]|uniref:Uncharacterized protein LOC106181105 n=1 Tax=Lingula anatina TaxID=7574 RepID=A0A1S3KDZ2_LINAN|nr:uncharacterized protein LOC106181105 [Lingula anatina]|eukprot:XP_013420843.1 uncharacterized protein LOC106181105 [Lingula anatina]
MGVGGQQELQLMAPHVHSFNPDARTVTYERLETLRLRSLGLENRYSRYNIFRQQPKEPDPLARANISLLGNNSETSSPAPESVSMYSWAEPTPTGTRGIGLITAEPPSRVTKGNTLAPFGTLAKPTCGYFFSRETDNRKLKFGIPPSDLVKWRSFNR